MRLSCLVLDERSVRRRLDQNSSQATQQTYQSIGL